MPDMTGSARPISAPGTRTTAGPSPDWSKTMTVPSAEVTVPVRMPFTFRPGPDSAGRLDQAQHFPVVPVEVGEAALVAVAVVARRADRAAARRFGLAGQLVHLLAGFHAEDQDHLGARRRVRDAVPRVRGEHRLGYQHDLG